MKKSKKKKTIGDLIWRVVFLAALVVFCYCAFQLITIYLEYKKGTDEYSSLEQKYVSEDMFTENETGGAAGSQHRGIHELYERADERCDGGDEDHELALDAQLILDGTIGEHDDQGCQGVNGVDLALLCGGHAQTVGRVGEPAGEEGPPDAPGTEEHENAEGALQIGRILPYRTCFTCHFDSLFLFAVPLPRGIDRFRCCFGLRLLGFQLPCRKANMASR